MEPKITEQEIPNDTSAIPSFVDQSATHATVDDLIPEELLSAMFKSEEAAAEAEQDEGEVEARPRASDVLLGEEDAPGVEQENPEPSEEAEEDFDLSSENLEKLLADGDEEAIKAKDASETPFWHEDEDYKAFLEKYNYAQLDQGVLDNVIKAASEKAAIANKKYQQSLIKEAEEVKARAEAFQKENERLKDIERAAYFDNLPEVVQKYSAPMNKAISEIGRILDTEGIEVSRAAVLQAKDRTQLTKLLENVELPQELNTQLVNHWRNYKELEFGYVNEKRAAVANLKASVNTTVSPEDTNMILQNAVRRVLMEDPKYSYIDEAIKAGLPDDSPVKDILSRAKGNFNGVLNALANPTEYARNNTWLENLSTFFLEAAHNEKMEQRVDELEKTLNQREADLKKVVKEFINLRNSAKGIANSTGGLHKVAPSSRQRVADGKKRVEELEALIRGDIDIDKVIP